MEERFIAALAGGLSHQGNVRAFWRCRRTRPCQWSVADELAPIVIVVPREARQ